MFPTFSGSSRKPRNVNLSGRKYAAPSTPRGPLLSKTPAHSASLITAQQERAQREAERRRLKAAIRLQKVWRGRRAAELQRKIWRKEWDEIFSKSQGRLDGCELVMNIVTLFLGFYIRGCGKNARRGEEDLQRLASLVAYLTEFSKNGKLDVSLGLVAESRHRWSYIFTKLGKLLVETLDREFFARETVSLLPWLVENASAMVEESYFKALSAVTVSGSCPQAEVLSAVLAPLKQKNIAHEGMVRIYRDFFTSYLTTPDLKMHLGASNFKAFSRGIDIGRITSVISTNSIPPHVTVDQRMWLLSHIIHLHSQRSSAVINLDDREYMKVLSTLLYSVAGEINKRIDIEDIIMDPEDSEDSDGVGPNRKLPLPEYVKVQLESLVDQTSVSNILAYTRSTDDDALMLAAFALTLLLVFPAKKQEVRMWLCMASTADSVPTIRYLWAAVKKTSLFKGITGDLRIAVDSLKERNAIVPTTTADKDDGEWNLILLFLELYGFLLIVMDDDEFFSGGSGTGKQRQLPLKAVEELSVFLKNLAFAMYWWGGEILGEDKRDWKRRNDGSRGWEVEHLRAATTGLLRAIYARDSRRRFVRKDHWLMTQRFNMEGFIPAVVAEEQNRHQLEDSSNSDNENDSDISLYPFDPAALAAMNPYERRNLHLERAKRLQRRQQRNNYLAAVTPRLEILKNLPFFIPFATRVQVFREFVMVDQKRRRGGFTDPDQWRTAVLSRHSSVVPTMGGIVPGNEQLSRHHATIKRNSVFEDAYEQFWSLGEGLKEPIQITFVDRFGAEEAGIDGGGVTKEFLTGVCGEAFLGSSGEEEAEDVPRELGFNGRGLFVENEEHLVYPNPTIIDELQELKRDRDERVKDVLKKYEFLGRIVGKCLYEGILVDIGFAPFFLLKWSQVPGEKSGATGGVGVNDLRDLDRGLYNGLVTLKNYPGDVEADFSLNFTVTSQLPSGRIKTAELKPEGHNIPVTNSNRLEYIHLISRFRLLLQPYLQTQYFLKGLNSIIDTSWLNMFNQTELQTLVGGDTDSPIDVEDLRRNTIYGGVYQVGDDGKEHESVQLFWEVMRGLGDAERRKVLKFVTSVARAPLLGFGVLRPRFSIRDAGEDQGRLCSASTCVNLLKLPRYKDLKTLREKLLYSVNSNAGFDLS
ncbi:ubiquitin-protein ligase (E3) [Rhizina undulata]